MHVVSRWVLVIGIGIGTRLLVLGYWLLMTSATCDPYCPVG